ncbi:hypothetical protein FRB93_008887 [Tulasnella sp. JGI-2019a]|nr:hypothetical protein FRB93_008887 [Tulasnella sp. JGI-2019a]
MAKRRFHHVYRWKLSVPGPLPLDLQDWLTDDCRMPATFAEVEAITIITFESIDPIRYLDIVGESKLEPQERILETVARYTLTLCGCTYEAQ